MLRKHILIIIMIIIIPVNIFSQDNTSSGQVKNFSLDQCIRYALEHQPYLRQTEINQSIVKTTNAINLSSWLPQLSLTGNLIHYKTLPTTLVPNPTPGGPPIASHNGVNNTSNAEFSASETIFDAQVMSAALTAPLYVKQSEQISDSARISLVSSVSNSFYSLLLTLEQVKILEEDTARLGRTVNDTHDQYVGGIVDETDYDQAVITLNNSKAQLRQQSENVEPGYAALKQLMGYPAREKFQVEFDTTQMDSRINFDTTRELQYEKRIEYQELQTEKKLQHQQKVYYELSFLPSVSVFYNYYFEYESNAVSNLFKNGYPYSFWGLSLSLPIFTGFSRIENIHRTSLQEDILDLDKINLRAQIYREYSSALANYRSNLYNWHLQKDNSMSAKNVYHIVQLQYEEGIIPYLNLIVAESNLITAEISYVNSLFQLLSSKTELEKAMGEVPINY